MISIKGIIRPFRYAFDPEKSPDRSRLCEAFEILDKNIQELDTSSGTVKHYTKIYSSVVVPIPNNTPTPIPYNSESSQNGGMHSTTTQNTRITIQRAGIYIITANVQWAGVGVGGFLSTLQIKVNNVSIIASVYNPIPAAGINLDQIVTGGDYFNIGDYIEIIATQITGGPVNIPVVANYSPYCFVMEN